MDRYAAGVLTQVARSGGTITRATLTQVAREGVERGRLDVTVDHPLGAVHPDQDGELPPRVRRGGGLRTGRAGRALAVHAADAPQLVAQAYRCTRAHVCACVCVRARACACVMRENAREGEGGMEVSGETKKR